MREISLPTIFVTSGKWLASVQWLYIQNQFKRVQDFFAQFDGSKGDHPALYQSFDTVENFETLLRENLQRVLLEYSETE